MNSFVFVLFNCKFEQFQKLVEFFKENFNIKLTPVFRQNK